MSYKDFLTLRSIEDGSRCLDTFHEVGIADGREFDEIDGPSEERPQRFKQAKVAIGVFSRIRRFEDDEEVEIACRCVEARADGRSKELQAAHTESPAQSSQLGSMGFD